MHLEAGAKLGCYEILGPLGAGGMGEVYKARDTRLDRIVAVKRLKSRHTTRFEQEARVIAGLNHPHICQIHDIGPDYLVLEYIEGQPLKGPLDVEEAVRLAGQIAEALDTMHRKGVVHRDLKPANIMVTAEGSVKLLDFGLAKQVADSEETATMEGTVMGTAAYMAPEQTEGKPLDVRSDVFSFGAVLYELLSGRQAFRGENSISTMAAILHTEPAPLDAPAALEQIVKRCLAKQPGQRYQTMAEIRAALESISGRLEEQQPSIAVLPFANMSRGADDEYFSDGLAEEILNVLAHIPGLKVTARTSSFAFRGKEQDITRIAETLRVRTILEGSVRRAGSRIRVKAQLINGADGYHLWSERYDRELTDVFAMQDEIAAAIAGALQVKLTGKPATTPHEPNLPAYEAFLKARHQFLKRSLEVPARTEDYYKQAIALDPKWAEPHTALGSLYFILGAVGFRPLSEMAPLARAEARKALELVPSEPKAHALLGAIAASHDYDWQEADEHFRLARASEPLPPEVHAMYAECFLVPLGRFEEAIQERAKAIAQDPVNAVLHAQQAFTLVCAERYELAMVEARKALALADRSPLSHWAIALSHFVQGRSAEAREPAEEAFRQLPWHSGVIGFLAGLLVQAGEKERAEKLMATMRGMIPVGMIFYHFVCSEMDATIDWYERGIEQHQPLVVSYAYAGFFKPLRSSPRWPTLARMMHLPEWS
jgi:serine/threonine protein kinase/Tfp pilus assembly protein PilF